MATSCLLKRYSSLIDILPGEIRNQIIMLCILGALKKSPSQTETKTNITASVLPKWNGPGCLRLDGIGALPLLFVNKQLHDEVLSFVDSMISELSIGGYILQYQNEDPCIRWRLVYSLLEKRPNLRKFAPSVRVSLPREGEELCWRHWASFGFPAPKRTGKRNSWLVLPDLEKELYNFPACQRLTVTVTVEKCDPPDFSVLIPLYTHFRGRITIEIVAPRFPGDQRGHMLPWVDKWGDAWAACISSIEE